MTETFTLGPAFPPRAGAGASALVANWAAPLPGIAGLPSHEQGAAPDRI
jgi:hypothetical protein